ncbi:MULTISPECIES: 16S rRNA (guanine(527)-N(7))-methyltransferase RsmG [Pseudoalteromonas]|uniref:Ribosomal RNA small subunit methyltransferase G n=1 Tax=Pseudoalteromonas peptidolytica F12-50-A1 TaxID=1315280 RepID=A0A8I0MST5_9GAMM|nr:MULTISPECIES: 16S rRNA (guanine(527)-N(7))-methyltransferase RsmG [Pseudoalteromonas]MBE0344609.1 16S rRNA (guanine527-N7)-methyltransferase [Pseudoalteromonas peptidolytica F12-50-A1]NLR15205.1 16S rRNA (guanine(527)-N(7))-methyltransferase RsmG [Pseudoalteromonas peptidolytica]RRS07304.1 16S rRNA (guanine(527)-N(7))-methyltransferase RsmG [Pseudoalteromonas sp. J010]RXE97511.1 16S rRNA (guanine(527)-N(7))-methyltransferase RsmG [Pseudoalteromonas sp. PS5]GEK07790.1 ribosomal RNA small sub
MLLEQLNELLADTSIELSEQQKQQLVDYVQLLDKWNKAYNLTSVRDPKEMMVKHIMDSLVVAPHLTGSNYIDVGTGPGLPGMVLAIARPDINFVLLDSLGKRVRFLMQVKHGLGIDNVTPVQSRVEEYQPSVKLDGVLSRAFASLQDMIQWCSHLIDDQGVFLALKGQYPADELEKLPNGVSLSQDISLVVPKLDGERHLIILSKD